MYILNYTDLDYIDISNSNMSSPYLDYIFYLTSSTSSSSSYNGDGKGTYFNLYNMVFNNISSSVFKWNTIYDKYNIL